LTLYLFLAKFSGYTWFLFFFYLFVFKNLSFLFSYSMCENCLTAPAGLDSTANHILFARLKKKRRYPVSKKKPTTRKVIPMSILLLTVVVIFRLQLLGRLRMKIFQP
jgi:hypothetical protein